MSAEPCYRGAGRLEVIAPLVCSQTAIWRENLKNAVTVVIQFSGPQFVACHAYVKRRVEKKNTRRKSGGKYAVHQEEAKPGQAKPGRTPDAQDQTVGPGSRSEASCLESLLWWHETTTTNTNNNTCNKTVHSWSWNTYNTRYVIAGGCSWFNECVILTFNVQVQENNARWGVRLIPFINANH